jgi:hypothetical protein
VSQILRNSNNTSNIVNNISSVKALIDIRRNLKETYDAIVVDAAGSAVSQIFEA